MLKLLALKKIVLLIFLALSVASIFLVFNLKTSFDFRQFFPEGDEDLIFYNDFIEDFGSDDSFLLIAIENPPSVFEQDFLERFHQFSSDARQLPYTKAVQSLTTLYYPLKTTFGYARLPIIHIKDSTKYANDWKRVQQDELLINSLIDAEGNSLVVALETEDELNYAQSIELLASLRASLKKNELTEYHFLGRAYFYEAIVKMQKRELLITSLVATLLVFLILFLIYRRVAVVLIALLSIVIALLLFLGLLSVLGKELNALAAFYPILMLIVGTSDVVHIMDSFLIKIRRGEVRESALIATLKEVGLVTLLTSFTTAIGFTSLLTSRMKSISDFGINSAIGVIVAYITVILLTSALLLLVDSKKLLIKRDSTFKWSLWLNGINGFTRSRGNGILMGSLVLMLICLYGIQKITTNYQFSEILPTGSQIAEDFTFFQNKFTGFRPLEVAVIAKGNHKVTDYGLVSDMDKVEKKLKTFRAIGNVRSVTSLYKGINRAYNLNKQEFFKLPDDKNTFDKYKVESRKIAHRQFNKLVDSNLKKARITTRVLDVGADSLTSIYRNIYDFIDKETDTTRSEFKLTGKGLLLDKNSVYARNSLLKGLALGLFLVALLMSLLYKNAKLVLISLIPNFLPLLFAGALLGFLGIPLEASISIVFAIVFGIAVDDTIHFLGKFRLCRGKGLDMEEAMEKTFTETGRALVITTLVLFFGFMVMLFSVHRPSVIIGLLISVTLAVALLIDLLLLPVLIRKLLR